MKAVIFHAPNARIRLEPGQRLESRHVLAGAYRGRGRHGSASNLEERTLLTHAVIVGADDRDVRTLCGFDKDRLGDTYGETAEDLQAQPSCPRCLGVWRRLSDEQAGAQRTEFGICEYCEEDFKYPSRRAKGIATMRQYNRPMNLCGVCGDLAGATIKLDPEHTTNARGRMRGGHLQEGDDAANRRRGASGRFQKSTMCDFCGKSCAAQHFTDDRLRPGSDDPGFYLCGRSSCVRARERLEAEQGFEALAQRYIEQRKKNEAVKRERSHPGPSAAVLAEQRIDKQRAIFTREGAIELAESHGHQMGPWEGNTATCSKCGQTVRFDPTYGASGTAWYRGSQCVQTPNASYYVWVLSPSGEPLSSEGPYGPYDLEGGKTFARIGATEGEHDRAVSLGLDPENPSFEVVRRYRRGTGERVL